MRSGNHQVVKKRLSGAKKRRRRAPRETVGRTWGLPPESDHLDGVNDVYDRCERIERLVRESQD